MSPNLRLLLAEILGSLVLYAFPFAAAVVVTRAAGRSRTLGVVGVFSTIVAGALHIDPNFTGILAAIALRALYYCCATYCLLTAVSVRGLRFTPPALFALCLLVFVLIPAVFEPPLGQVLFSVVAWEIALSAYSACDAATRKRTLSRSELAFFILVNPVMVYPSRGKPVAAGTPVWRPTARAIAGAAVLALGCAAVIACDPAIWHDTPIRIAPDLPLAPLLFAAQYAMHSGRGALGVSFMRLLGTEIPERYHYPLAARSPSDFWRRWNVYVGEWALRYVFIPVARNASAMPKGRASQLAWQVVALFTAMAAVGFVHDLGNFTASFVPSARSTGAFLAFGLIAATWHAAEAGMRQLAGRLGRRPNLRIAGLMANAGFLLTLFWAVRVFWS